MRELLPEDRACERRAVGCGGSASPTSPAAGPTSGATPRAKAAAAKRGGIAVFSSESPLTDLHPHLGATGQQFFKDYVDHYRTPDPRTLIIKMKQPNAWTLSQQNLCAPNPALVVPKELIDQNLLEKKAVSAGPYVLESFDPASEIVFSRRPDGWHFPERPYIDKVVYRVITDAAAREAALKAKLIDSLAARDKIQADELKAMSPDMQIDRELTSTVFHLRSDVEGYFKDARVREAIYSGLDIQELIDMVELGEPEANGPVLAHLKAWLLPTDEIKKAFPHDLQKAKQLPSAAGWDAARVVDYKYAATEKAALLAQVVQKQLEATGIKTKLVPQDARTVWGTNTFTARDFQITTAYQTWGGKSPDVFLMRQTTTGRGGGNQSRRGRRRGNPHKPTRWCDHRHKEWLVSGRLRLVGQ